MVFINPAVSFISNFDWFEIIYHDNNNEFDTRTRMIIPRVGFYLGALTIPPPWQYPEAPYGYFRFGTSGGDKEHVIYSMREISKEFPEATTVEITLGVGIFQVPVSEAISVGPFNVEVILYRGGEFHEDPNLYISVENSLSEKSETIENITTTMTPGIDPPEPFGKIIVNLREYDFEYIES